MFALGLDFFAAGMLDRAESVFQELLESNNKWVSNAEICESLRTIYEQTQEWQKAIEATQCSKKSLAKDGIESNNGVNLDSLITHYYCELADDSLEKGNLHEVDGFVENAKKIQKKSTRLMTLQGDIALHQKQYKDSLNYYLNAVKQDSRLLSMLFEKIDDSANNSNDIQLLQTQLLKMYQNQPDNNVFEAILKFADKYGSNKEINTLVDEVLESKKISINSIYKASGYIKNTYPDDSSKGLGLIKVHKSLEKHLQGVPSFRCEHCGYKMHDYLWRCPACNYWDTVDQAL